jgi:hypothetical protein
MKIGKKWRKRKKKDDIIVMSKNWHVAGKRENITGEGEGDFSKNMDSRRRGVKTCLPSCKKDGQTIHIRDLFFIPMHRLCILWTSGTVACCALEKSFIKGTGTQDFFALLFYSKLLIIILSFRISGSDGVDSRKDWGENLALPSL